MGKRNKKPPINSSPSNRLVQSPNHKPIQVDQASLQIRLEQRLASRHGQSLGGRLRKVNFGPGAMSRPEELESPQSALITINPLYKHKNN